MEPLVSPSLMISEATDVDVDNETRELAVFSGIKCCSGRVWKGVIYVLCVVDWLHVLLAIMAMAKIISEAKGAQAAATTCLCLYLLKICSHIGLVMLRLWQNHHQSKHQANDKVGAWTHAWYESQEWFVASECCHNAPRLLCRFAPPPVR